MDRPGAIAASARHIDSHCDGRRIWLPVPEVNPRLWRVRSCEHHTDRFRLDLFREREVLALAVVLAVCELAAHGDLDLVRTGRNVAGVDPLHSASAQRVELLEAIDVTSRESPVDLNLHRIETQRLAVRKRHEHREVT